MELLLEDIHKDFGKVKVLSGINLKVEDGEFCVLLGPSGCGKSTLLRIIAGLEPPTRGKVFIGRRDVTLLTPRERDVAMVFQSYALYPHMNVFDNMAFSLRIRGLLREEIKRRVERAAEFLEIKDLLARKPYELSGGQRQRVAIGRAIVREPSLFLFDEPLSNLDAVLRVNMRVELVKLHKRLKSTMVYVTHDQVEAMTLGEKIVVIDAGVIQQVGSPQAIYNRPANIFVASFVGTPTINLIKGDVCREGERVFCRSKGVIIELGERIASYAGKPVTIGIRPEDISIEPRKEGGLDGVVEIVENIGSERLIYLSVGESRVVVRTDPSAQWREGDQVSLKLNTGKIHFFYQGERIAVNP